MAISKKPTRKSVMVTDDAAVLRCVAGDGVIREEVWEDAEGNVVRFNLAFINHHLFQGDHGRVLGYDTAHGYLHRHFAGSVEEIEPALFQTIFAASWRKWTGLESAGNYEVKDLHRRLGRI
jgi:hypothetical protein